METYYTSYWKFYFDLIKDVKGDIVECGVGRGRSLKIISKVFPDRDIYGYDSFEGFPEPTIQDKSPRNPKKGEWSDTRSGRQVNGIGDGRTKCTKEWVQNIIPNVILRGGFFNKSLKSHPILPIALLHVDGDLYQAHKDTLEVLFDRVASGGVIVFDDIHEGYFPGGMIAVREFFGDRFDDFQLNEGKYYYIKP